MSCGHRELGSEALPSFVFWRAAANSAVVKSPQICGVAIDALQLSDTWCQIWCQSMCADFRKINLF